VQLLGKALHPYVSLTIQCFTITFLLVLFGAVLPKIYAKQYTMRMAIFAAPIVKFMVAMFSPISNLLINSSQYLDEKMEHYGMDLKTTEDAFERKLELSVGQTATPEEVNIFKGILRFRNITARQIMHTRLDVSGIPYGYDFSQVLRFITNTGFSRLPVYQDSLDTIVGMIHSKDLLPYLDEKDFDWHAIIRQAYYVPENKLVDDLLKEFQQNRIHFAVVVDEFGGTSGILTLEDIMEEIIGDIKDEFDDDVPTFKKIDDEHYIFDGKALINDVCRWMNITPEVFDKVRGESDSLAGLLLEIAGKFPAINEVIIYQNFDFTVLETDRMRIKRVKISINKQD
jgi:gliding motility-associated protein GldE